MARALSPASMFRPTETIKLTPILDFIEIGGLVSSVCTGLSLPGGVESLRMIEPCGMLVGNAVRGKYVPRALINPWFLGGVTSSLDDSFSD